MDFHIKTQTLAAIVSVVLSAMALSGIRLDTAAPQVPESVNLETESGNDGPEVYLWIGGTEFRMSPQNAESIGRGLMASAASARLETEPPEVAGRQAHR